MKREKYIIGQVHAKGNVVNSEDQITKSLKVIGAGKVFSPEGYADGASNIQSLYFDQGYIFAQALGKLLSEPETDRVDATYSIDEGIIGYVDKIKIQGNIKTKDKVIRREWGDIPGVSALTGINLRRSKERLQNLGFFEEVGYDIEPSDSPLPK